ncbi:uncharacterized protein LOC123522715 [Echinops telfairi]|uniref:Uncharacterized protein LOC123522715 n=1 Tax=Echinops telfairi TaxID=9371 RepID=A0AC55DUJ4_ECHTE|nr:uncharacterized protein LOC123522715 [Echinops telfairi]
MNVKLTKKELDQLKESLSNAYEKVDMKKLMDKVEAITGKEVDVDDIETFLGDMGIELTNKEFSKLMSNLPIDDGKVYQQRLMDGMKFLNGGMIDASKISALLRIMGTYLTEQELKDLTQNLPVDVNGKVDLKKVLNRAKAFTGQKVDINKLDNILGNLEIELTPSERMNLLKTLPVNEKSLQYERPPAAFENLLLPVQSQGRESHC